MWATWNFSAAPEPTTASLIARGAYSNTGTPSGMAHSAAPRACPSFSALSALRLTNTRSTATSAGACSESSALSPSKIRRSRAAGAAAATFRQPCATGSSSLPRHSITPKPVRREPGSRPRIRIRTAAASGVAATGSKARQDLVRYLDIRVHVPDVFQPLERLEQLHHRLRVISRELERRGRAACHFGSGRREPVMRQHRAHSGELERIGQHLDRSIGTRHDVLCAGLERHLHEALLVGSRRIGEQPHRVEQVTHRADRPELTAMLHEGAPHFSADALTIPGDAFHHHRCAAWAIALVVHPLQALAGYVGRAPAAHGRVGARTPLYVGPPAVPRHDRWRPRPP